ncbi:M28 family peptidase [Clostridiaceae bacterium HSG29]|nr:M28 family peptidase [Clostridiaceae bacterium HSG29]
MKRVKLEIIITIFLILSLFGFNSLYYSIDTDKFKFDDNRIEKEISIITDEYYQGHIAGSKENNELAKYIEESLLNDGYQSSNETVNVNSFKMLSVIPDPEPVMELGTEISQISYRNFEDYRIIRNSYSGNINYEDELFFVKGNLNSLNPEDVNGKVIVTSLYANQQQTIDNANKLGIRGILYSAEYRYSNIENRQLGIGKKTANNLFMANISGSMYESLKEVAEDNNGSIPYSKIVINDSYINNKGNNIVAMVEGTDPTHELYIVSHFDGKGKLAESYYPGATKNASAIAIMLELAKVIHDSNYQPEYSIGFVFLDGHELGNIGAEAFLKKYHDNNKTQEFVVLNDIGVDYSDKLFLNNSSRNIIPTEEANIVNAKAAMLSRDADINISRFNSYYYTEGIFPGSTAEYFANEKTAVIELKNMDMLESKSFINTTEDTKEKVDLEKVMDVETILIHYIYYEIMGFFDLNYLIFPERFIINAIFVFILFINLINLLYKYNPSLKIRKMTIRDVYLSIPYNIFKKIIAIIVPTVIMLFIMVCVLSIPHYTSSSLAGAGYDNYLPYIHIKHTFLYIRMLIFSGIDAINSDVVNVIIIASIKSFKLLTASLSIAFVLGIGLGMRNGLKRSQIRTFLGLMVFSIPDVVISLGALYSIIYWFKDIFITPETLRTIVMPGFAMIIVPAIYIARIIEVAVIEEKDQSYIYGALSRGVSKRGVIWRYIFPKVMSKLFDTMGIVIRIAIINLIVVEYIFSALGIGSYLMNNYRDAFFVIYISFGFGLMYFILTSFFKLLSWLINPLKRRIV